MGTDIQSIQNAYQGFAKGQYTMLDNLKLGYGGTKTEMQRLIKDANKIAKQQGINTKLSIKNYADIVTAIHLVQSEMGITGTTAKEAASTISGSLSMTRSAWGNLLTGMADDNADFDLLIKNFSEAVQTLGTNILPRIKTTITGMATAANGLIAELLPPILQTIPPMIVELMPTVVTAFESVMNAAAEAFPQLVSAFAAILPQIIESLVGMAPSLVNAGMDAITALLEGLNAAAPGLIAAIPPMVMGILDTFIANLPQLVTAGLQLIETISAGVAEALPQLIEYMPTLVAAAAKALTDNLPQILASGVAIVTNILTGIANSLPALVAAAPAIVKAIVDALIAAFPSIVDAGKQLITNLITGIGSMMTGLVAAAAGVGKIILDELGKIATSMLDVGSNIVKGIWNGISSGGEWIKNKITGWVGDVTSFIKNLFGIASPSKVMRDEVGKWLPLGMAEGFERSMPNALMTMKHSVNDALSDLKTDLSLQANGMFGGVGSDATAGGQVINFNQYNNSPKALDRLTIYRQTNSLLFAAKVGLANV